MKKVLSNIKYKIKYQSIWVVWYLVVYVVVMFLLYLILLQTDVINSNTGSLGYRIWGIVLFQFVVSTRFKEDFNLFIAVSNTRTEIFQTVSGVAIVFSILFSGLIVVERIFFDFLNNLFGLYLVKDAFHYFAPYNNGNNFILFIFFFMLCICFSAIGILLGSLFYRLGKKFIVFFWLFVSLLPVILLPLYAWLLYKQNLLSETIYNISEFLKNFDVLHASGCLVIVTIVFSVISYFNIRKLPQV